MNIQDLIKLANLLDDRGEYEAAGEIDKLIESSAGVSTPDSMGEDYSDPGAGAEKDPTMRNLEEGEVLQPEEYEGERKETMTMEPVVENEGPVALREALDAFIDSPRRFENHYKLKKLMDDYILAAVPEKSASIDGVFKKLTDVADSLDKEGAKEEANMIDGFIAKYADYNEDRKEEGDTEQSKRYDDKHHHNLQVREPKRDQERVDREGRKEHHIENYRNNRMSLSTRYCPEHIGDQMGRVGPGVYQCSRDGQVFNWEVGFDTLDGEHYDGGSVAAMTPDSTGYAIPNRIFDSREKVLNVIN